MAIDLVTITKIVAPFAKTIFNSSKDLAKTALSRWDEKDFPERLAQQIINLGRVRTLNSRKEDILLSSFYYPSKIYKSASQEFTHNKRGQVINSIDDFEVGNIVIEGIVGQGKSMLARHLAIQEIIKPKNIKLPIFIELKNITKENTLEKAIFKVLSTYDIDIEKDSFNRLAQDGRFTIFLDAFDELDNNLVKETLTYINFFIHKYFSTRLIITSRPNSDISKFAGFTIYQIADLQPNDYAPFLKRINIESEYARSIISAIKSSPLEIKEFITTPLMLTLVVMLYRSESNIPQTIPKFFETLFDVVFTEHDLSKGRFCRERFSKLGDEQIKDIFSAFCFMCLKKEYGRTLEKSQFVDAFNEASKYVSSKCDVQEFRSDLVKTSCLMLEEGLDLTTFLHKSLMEYYAASYIKKNTDDFAQKFYNYVADDYRDFEQVLIFLKDIDVYRFNKYYVMRSLGHIEKIFSTAVKTRNDHDLIDAINIEFPHLRYGYILSTQDNDGTVYTVGGYGSGKNQFYELIDDFLLDSMHSTWLDIKGIEINKKITSDADAKQYETTRGYDIPINLFLKHFSSAKFWINLDKLMLSINEVKDAAKKIIEFHDSRTNIFDDF